MKKPKFQKLLINNNLITQEKLDQDLSNKNYVHITKAIDEYAKIILNNIVNRKITLEPLKNFTIKEGNKIRKISEESAEQQIYEYIAQYALQPLFQAKIWAFQYGSIQKKGGLKAKNRLYKLYKQCYKKKNFVAIKCDIQKAYPSTKLDVVMKFLKRDIHKNKALIWLIKAITSNYPNGSLIIGGYLSCWLFNYVMSYVLRELMNHHAVRRGKRHNSVYKCVCYADDFIVFGQRGRLIKALKHLTIWAKKNCGLTIKPQWQITNLSKQEYIKTLGYKISYNYVKINNELFLKIRKQLIKANKKYKRQKKLTLKRAQTIISYWGWIKYIDNIHLLYKYQISNLLLQAKKVTKNYANVSQSRIYANAANC